MEKKRKPTDKEYKIFDGMHCFRIWNILSDNWKCPICGKTKRKLMKWGKRVGSNKKNMGNMVLGYHFIDHKSLLI